MKVIDLPAGSSFQAVASQGISAPLASARKRVSKAGLEWNQLFIPACFKGSPRLTPSLVNRLNFKVPPSLGCPAAGEEAAGDEEAGTEVDAAGLDVGAEVDAAGTGALVDAAGAGLVVGAEVADGVGVD